MEGDNKLVQRKFDSSSIEIPLLSIVPVPYIAVNEVLVDFDMEVTSTEASTVKSSTKGSSSSNCFDGWSVNVGGKVSSSRKNTRSTNQTARYQVDESNRQQRQTEGLSKLKDIMDSCVEPLPTKKNDEE